MSINSHHVSVIQKSEILVVCGFKCSWIKGRPSLGVGVDAPYYRTTRQDTFISQVSRLFNPIKSWVGWGEGLEDPCAFFDP